MYIILLSDDLEDGENRNLMIKPAGYRTRCLPPLFQDSLAQRLGNSPPLLPGIPSLISPFVLFTLCFWSGPCHLNVKKPTPLYTSQILLHRMQRMQRICIINHTIDHSMFNLKHVIFKGEEVMASLHQATTSPSPSTTGAFRVLICPCELPSELQNWPVIPAASNLLDTHLHKLETLFLTQVQVDLLLHHLLRIRLDHPLLCHAPPASQEINKFLQSSLW